MLTLLALLLLREALRRHLRGRSGIPLLRLLVLQRAWALQGRLGQRVLRPSRWRVHVAGVVEHQHGSG